MEIVLKRKYRVGKNYKGMSSKVRASAAKAKHEPTLDKAGLVAKRLVDQRSQEIAARVVLVIEPSGRRRWER